MSWYSFPATWQQRVSSSLTNFAQTIQFCENFAEYSLQRCRESRALCGGDRVGLVIGLMGLFASRYSAVWCGPSADPSQPSCGRDENCQHHSDRITFVAAEINGDHLPTAKLKKKSKQTQVNQQQKKRHCLFKNNCYCLLLLSSVVKQLALPLFLKQ